MTQPAVETAARLAPLLPAGEPVQGLLRRARRFTPGAASPDYSEVHRADGRGAEEFYRERWRHDKQVRPFHGVNCTEAAAAIAAVGVLIGVGFMVCPRRMIPRVRATTFFVDCLALSGCQWREIGVPY